MVKKVMITASAMIMVFTVFAFAKTNNEYWDNGKLRIIDEYNAQGEVIGKIYYNISGDKERQEKYNDNGDKISLAYFNKDGKLKTGFDGWAAIKWKFEDGNMVGEGYYGEDGKLQEYKRYNSAGDLVDKKYFGGEDPDPSEEYGSEPTLAGESMEFYDKEGREEGSSSISYEEPFFPYFFPFDE